MATPPRVSENPATQRNYVAQLTIAAALSVAVRRLWESLNPLSSSDALAAFGAGARAIVEQFAQAAVVVAGDNYLATRHAAGFTDPIRLPAVSSVPAAKVDKELAWIERQIAADMAAIEAQLLKEADEAFQKAVADEARQFTVDAVAGDERALGFRRVPRPDACAWCLLLATRKTTRRGFAKDVKGVGRHGGDKHFGVYKSRASAGQLPAGATSQVNRYHFNCHCTVEPVFDPAATVPDWLQDAADLYDTTPDGLNGFRRALNAQRRGETPPDPTPILPASTTSGQREHAAAVAGLLAQIDDAMRVA